MLPIRHYKMVPDDFDIPECLDRLEQHLSYDGVQLATIR